MKNTTLTLATALLGTVAACTDHAAIARSDSLATKLSEQQQLSDRLASQKDSLMRVVVDADAFIGQMDSAISTVRGLPRGKKPLVTDPIAAQLQARKDVQDRVNALVGRAKQTSAQLVELQKKQEVTDSINVAQATKIMEDAQLIADLGATIERQRTEIAALGARLDSLGTEVRTVSARHYRAYYVVGTEKELRNKGVVVKEGGANLLFGRVGRTLVPARVLDTAAFTPIDQRAMKDIELPDSTSRYRIVSRQTLDDAEVDAREGNTFKGHLKITDPDEFWAASRFLILVKQ
jgi:hypothetical protein